MAWKKRKRGTAVKAVEHSEGEILRELKTKRATVSWVGSNLLRDGES